MSIPFAESSPLLTKEKRIGLSPTYDTYNEGCMLRPFLTCTYFTWTVNVTVAFITVDSVIYIPKIFTTSRTLEYSNLLLLSLCT